MHVNTDADSDSSNISDMSCEFIIADSTTEETRMAMPGVEQKEKLSKGAVSYSYDPKNT